MSQLRFFSISAASFDIIAFKIIEYDDYDDDDDGDDDGDDDNDDDDDDDDDDNDDDRW